MVSQGSSQLSRESLLDLLDLGQAMVLDLDERIIFWTSGCQRLYGYSPLEAMGRTSFELMQTKFSQPLAQIKEKLEEAGHWEGQLVQRHRDGHAVTVMSLWALQRDGAGRPVAILEENQDITELKRLESGTFDNTAVGVTHIDGEGRWMRLNRKFCRVLGYAEAELVGRRFTELTHPDDQEEDLRQYERLMRGEIESYVLEKRHIRKDGECIWMRVLRAAQRDEGDRQPYSICVSIIEDIGARKQAEEELLASRQRLAGIIDSAMDAIVTVDEGQRIVLFNPAAEKMFGCAAGAAVGSDIGRFIPERFRGAHSQHIRNFGQTGQTTRSMGHLGAIHGLRQDGEEFPIEASISQVQVSGQKLFTVILRDITARRAAEEALIAAKSSAERAKAAAEQANQAKDHFMAVLSHELRTPLTPVLATATMLETDPRLDADLRQSLEVIRRNAELEARLIDDLLDMTRIARGKVELNRRPVAMCVILERAVEVCRPNIEARGLHFGVDLKGAPHIVHVDAGRMQQVFWNLLSNAVKFTPQGGCVGVRCWREGQHVITEVSDSGVGIEAEVLPQIFSAFEQGRVETTRQFGGLGLGLTISKALVERHGGSIEARSAGKGKGATFTVRLPVAEMAVAAEAAVGPVSQSVSVVNRKLAILVVEDHGDTSRIMRRLLEASGHEVETAADMATALRLSGERQFDLLLSDLGLPDGSGLELLRTLRARGSTVPAIALSGYGQEQDIAQSLATGFAAHLTKPTNFAQLEAAMIAATGQGAGRMKD